MTTNSHRPLRRLLFIPFVLAFILPLAAACGGDDDSSATGTGSPDTSGNSTPAATLTPAESPTATPEQALPTPTRVADDEPLLVITYGDQTVTPTAADLAAYQQSEIEVDGQSYSGALLADIAGQMGAPAESTVYVEGIRSDGLRFATVRFALADVADGTVFYIGDSGHVNYASSAVAPAQWLMNVSAITFQ